MTEATQYFCEQVKQAVSDGHHLCYVEASEERGVVTVIGINKSGDSIAAALFALDKGDVYDGKLIEEGFAFAAAIALAL